MAVQRDWIDWVFTSRAPIYEQLRPITGLALRIVTGAIMLTHSFEDLSGRRTLPEWFTEIGPFAGFIAEQGYEPAYF